MQFKQMPILATTLASTVLMGANSSNATNLIINGGFADTSEAGLNAFTSDYNFDGVKGDDLWIFLEDRNPGEYIISSNPAGNVPEEWPELSSFDSGNDNMLVADSFSSGSEERVLWGQEVNVKAGTTYSFNFAVARIFTTDVIVDAKVNGISILSEPKALSEQGKWDFLEANWTANSTGFVTLEIFQNRNISLGTDIALDAISLTAISESISEPTSIISLMILGLGFLVDNMTWKRSENSSSPTVSSNNRLTLAQTRLEEILAEEAIAVSQYNQLCQEKASLLNQVKTDKTINLEPEEKSINQEIGRVLQVIRQLKVERTQAQVQIEHFFIQFKSNLFEFL